jgi:hypothetical protein
MIKKMLGSVIAAGALSVPLAGLAWADGDGGNGIGAGGVTGELGGNSFGSIVSGVAQVKPPGSLVGFISDGKLGAFGTPGGTVKNVFTPGAGQGQGPKP